MENTIRNFNEQLLFKPIIENGENFSPAESFILCGMGGSHLSAGLAKIHDPSLSMLVHYDYGLPLVSEDRLKNSLLIASSFSGNTEETLSFAKDAHRKGLNLLSISSGGKLIEFSKKNNVPYIIIPRKDGMQPRHALGFSACALALALSNDAFSDALKKLGKNLNPESIAVGHERIVEVFKNKIPHIYASHINHALAYMWKIELNETTKIPAFFNMFPELNHNELSSFDGNLVAKEWIQNFSFLLLKDDNDRPEIRKRMEITEKLYKEKGMKVFSIELSGNSSLEKAFHSIFLCWWTALRLSQVYGVSPDDVPLIEKFKKLL